MRRFSVSLLPLLRTRSGQISVWIQNSLFWSFQFGFEVACAHLLSSINVSCCVSELIWPISYIPCTKRQDRHAWLFLYLPDQWGLKTRENIAHILYICPAVGGVKTLFLKIELQEFEFKLLFLWFLRTQQTCTSAWTDGFSWTFSSTTSRECIMILRRRSCLCPLALHLFNTFFPGISTHLHLSLHCGLRWVWFFRLVAHLTKSSLRQGCSEVKSCRVYCTIRIRFSQLFLLRSGSRSWGMRRCWNSAPVPWLCFSLSCSKPYPAAHDSCAQSCFVCNWLVGRSSHAISVHKSLHTLCMSWWGPCCSKITDMQYGSQTSVSSKSRSSGSGKLASTVKSISHQYLCVYRHQWSTSWPNEKDSLFSNWPSRAAYHQAYLQWNNSFSTPSTGLRLHDNSWMHSLRLQSCMTVCQHIAHFRKPSLSTKQDREGLGGTDFLFEDKLEYAARHDASNIDLPFSHQCGFWVGVFQSANEAWTAAAFHIWGHSCFLNFSFWMLGQSGSCWKRPRWWLSVFNQFQV